MRGDKAGPGHGWALFPAELLGPLLSALPDANICVDVTGRSAGHSAQMGGAVRDAFLGAPEGVRPGRTPTVWQGREPAGVSGTPGKVHSAGSGTLGAGGLQRPRPSTPRTCQRPL